MCGGFLLLFWAVCTNLNGNAKMYSDFKNTFCPSYRKRNQTRESRWLLKKKKSSSISPRITIVNRCTTRFYCWLEIGVKSVATHNKRLLYLVTTGSRKIFCSFFYFLRNKRPLPWPTSESYISWTLKIQKNIRYNRPSESHSGDTPWRLRVERLPYRR